ncbi:MAG: hypothetical protein JWM82_4394, partial [Myxococcales bacterium]|nr:hypothetical protein [Myxococcales bacterium]
DRAPGEAGDARTDGADARDGSARDGYANDGACTPGVPRCHGDFGYELCEQDGGWSESHSCGGYSSNGTTSYCAELPTESGEPWATCIDPACWYWWKRGVLGKTPDGSSVGICLPDGTINKCSPGGTLSVAQCAGACSRVATLDGRALGFCAPACVNGARECLGGPFYRACVDGHWDTIVRACAGTCNPLATGAVPDLRCGGACDPGTSRCRADDAAVELCADDGTWKLDRACTLGRCRPAGPQAECEAECLTGQHACAFDGDRVERRCDDAGRWTAEMPCATDTSCRLSGDLALGCVACVGDGNAFGIADSRCVSVTPDGGGSIDGGAGANVAVGSCGPQNGWQSQITCASNETCTAISRGPSTLAACQLR